MTNKWLGLNWLLNPGSVIVNTKSSRLNPMIPVILAGPIMGTHLEAACVRILSGLDPHEDRDEITTRILSSRAGDLLEYLKTL